MSKAYSINCLLPFFLCFLQVNGWNVTLYSETFQKGTPYIFNVSTCQNVLQDLKKNVSSINSQGHCVYLYRQENCSGEYIVIKPGSPVHYDLSVWGYEKGAVSSMGPCLDRCHPQIVEKREANKSYFVTVYEDTHNRGPHMTFNVDGCTQIPMRLKRRISSVQVNGNFCIELHHNWDCTGYHAQLQGNSIKHDNLKYWVGHEDESSAISLCGFDCNNGTRNLTRSLVRPVANATIAIYDEPKFEGEQKGLNITPGMCLNLDDQWESQVQSIRSFGHCVILFNQFNCSTPSYGRNFTLRPEDNSTAPFLARSQFTRTAQSLMLCPNNPSNRTVKALTGEETKHHGLSGLSKFMIVVAFLIFISFCSVGIAYVWKVHYKGRARNSHELLF